MQSRGIRRVVMESTGYHWIPLFWMLQSCDFEVMVVNPTDVKRYNRPKTDVLDACWLQRLHALGLLRSSFQMDNFGETLRAYVRRRRNILQDRTRQVNRMHKVLILMNVQIGTQPTDLGGASGMDIVRDIVAETGRDLHQFPAGGHYASWLGLAPNNKISGGKVLSSRTPARANRAATAFRQAANAVGRCKNHPPKAFFHAILKRKGWNGAVTATARKLAVIYYNMVSQQQPFNYQTPEEQQTKKRAAILKKIQKSIKELQFTAQEPNLNAA